MNNTYTFILFLSITIFSQSTPNAELEKYLPKMIEVLQTDTSFMVTIDYYRPLPHEIKKDSSKTNAFRRSSEIRRESCLRSINTAKKTLVIDSPVEIMTFLARYNGFVTNNTIITDTMALFSLLPYLHSKDSQFCLTLLLQQTSYNTIAQNAQRIKQYIETSTIYNDRDMLALYCLLLSPQERKVLLVDTTFLSSIKRYERNNNNMAPLLAFLGNDSAENVVIESYKTEKDYVKRVNKISSLVYVGSDRATRTLLQSFNDTIFGACSTTIRSSMIEALDRRHHDIPIIAEYNQFFHPISIYTRDPQWAEEYLSRFNKWILEKYNIVPQGSVPNFFEKPCGFIPQ